MTDWADGIETRNYGIRNEIDGNLFPDLMRTVIPLVMIAGALLFYSWVRSQIVNLGYESQNLFAQEESLLQTQKKLILEEETFSNPEQIDLIARVELGMTPLRPNQFILAGNGDAVRGLPNTIAMANYEAAGMKYAAVGASSYNPAD